ncbi:MAG: PEP/pyruvate-binding domain-containing protein, partial [Candidatus Omnitrophica bacterium]|nr:PEP/pyruvate-binding domain-containing protein [Candidatus Omnitrophota bacterium]
PISSSVDTVRIFSEILKKEAKRARRYLDYWERLFMKAEDMEEGPTGSNERKRMVEQLCRIIVARDEKILRLAKRYISLRDILDVKARMIGTGFIGGKSVGMLIARAILLKDKGLDSKELFEPHDSFYIGSDVFYAYVAENGWWRLRMEQRTKDGYFDVARTLKVKLISGIFPEEIKEQFRQMIEYFGQSPIIVRSSSLLEDSYGNAFAGKYESIFLVNQGTPEERYTKFTDAVRRIYASTMNEDALSYRLQRGLDQADEQMALLVQRVSGSYRSGYFFPDVARVGISYNTFVWKSTIDPKAGMLRLVLGLGTRAVNRVEGDYPRIVALDDPLLKAHANMNDTRRFSQHDVDVLNVKDNVLETIGLKDLIKNGVDIRLDLIAVKESDTWIITFDRLASENKFRNTMIRILKTLEAAYEYPIDIEFTINFREDDEFRINILQCRPVQTKGLGRRVEMPSKIGKGKTLFRSTGNFLGGNISQEIGRIIYVDPAEYAALASQSQKYDIARAVGEITRKMEGDKKPAVMLMGPGRWGTSTPSLGVPVSFAEISNVAILVEIAFASANAVPELSFGTHFFQDLVETGIFYLALFPDSADTYINRTFFDSLPNTLKKIAPQYKKYGHVIKVLDIKNLKPRIAADIVSQRLVCYKP